MQRKDTIKPSHSVFSNSTGSLITFLIAELLFFIVFGLDQNGTIIRVIGIVLLVIGLWNVFTITKFKREEIAPLVLGGGMLLIFGVLAGYGSYYGASNFITILSVVLAFLTFLLLGFLLPAFEGGNIKIILYGIYVGLAVLVLINLIVNLYNYGFFYLARYEGQVFYYDGQPVVIANQVRYLLGTEFVYADEAVAGFNNGLLASLLLPAILNYRNFKKPSTRWILIGLGALGVLALALYPNVQTLLLMVPAMLAILVIYYYDKAKKWLKPTLFVVLGLFAVFLIFAALWAYDVFNVFQYLPVFKRIFASGYMARWQEVLQNISWLGYGWSELNTQQATGNFLLDILYQFGVIAFIMMLLFIAFAIYTVYKYYTVSKDEKGVKLIIISFLITLLSLSLFNYPYHQLIEFAPSLRAINHHPITNSGPFMVAIFLIGYTISAQYEMEEPTLISASLDETQKEIVEEVKTEDHSHEEN